MTARRIDIAEVRRLAAAGMSGEEIGRKTGFAGNSVRGFAKRHGIALCRGSSSGGCPESEFWAEHGDHAIDMLDNGASMSAIAAAIGTTKNAVIGRFHRQGLCKSTQPLPPPRQYIEFPPHGHCQFIHGDVGEPDFAFCGDITKPGSAYCSSHHRVCYRPAGEMRDAAD